MNPQTSKVSRSIIITNVGKVIVFFLERAKEEQYEEVRQMPRQVPNKFA